MTNVPTDDGGSDDRRLKQVKLDQHLPEDSDLRSYLAVKDDTARRRTSPPPARLAPYRAALGRLPRTLLVMPPMCLFEGAVKRVIPPLGLCYIAAALRQEGIDVDILDCIVEGIDEETLVGAGIWRFGMSEDRFRDHVRTHDYDVVGFSMIYSSDLANLYRYAAIVKEERPDTVVVAGGLHASIYAKRFLQDAAADGEPIVDFVLRGEGEIRLGDFLRHLADGQVDLTADGLAGWVNGDLVVNPQYARISDLDALPIPAYDKVPLERYFEHNVPFSPFPQGRRVMQVYTSRGCPVGCTFCASTNFAKAYYARSPDNVIAEIEHYRDAYGIDEIQFADDNLTLDRGRALELFDKLADRGLPWCTPNGIMINTLTVPLLDAMARSGLYQITLSIDSGNAKTLKERHRKPVDLTRIPDLVAHLHTRGVLVHGTLVVGMPGETEEDIAEGFRFVEDLPLNSINVFIAQAIHGSELFERSVADGAMSYQAAMRIDTARSTLRLSSLDGEVLEEMVETFLSRYNQQIHDRDPVAWQRKYGQHQARLQRICVGVPSANTSAIAEVRMP